MKNIETSAKTVKKTAYSNKKNKVFIVFDDKKGKNIGIEYRLQSIFCNPACTSGASQYYLFCCCNNFSLRYGFLDNSQTSVETKLICYFVKAKRGWQLGKIINTECSHIIVAKRQKCVRVSNHSAVNEKILTVHNSIIKLKPNIEKYNCEKLVS